MTRKKANYSINLASFYYQRLRELIPSSTTQSNYLTINLKHTTRLPAETDILTYL